MGSVAIDGDIDGDGLSDLVVGAPRWDIASGAVYIYLGKNLGPGMELAPEDADYSITHDDFRLNYGCQAMYAGDVDGDGLDDLLIWTATPGGVWRATATSTPMATPTWSSARRGMPTAAPST